MLKEELLKEVVDEEKGTITKYYTLNGKDVWYSVTTSIPSEEDEEDYEQREGIDEKVERLEKEQLITMTALVEKHEETLELKKMNEKLQEMNLIALQGVAELNGEVQKLKKEMEASAD